MLLYSTIYLICFCILIIGLLCKQEKLSFFFVGYVLLVFYGFRYEVGRDYSTYEIIYNNINQIDSLQAGFENLEKGYLFLNRLFYSLNLNFQSIVFLETTLLVVAFLHSIYKFSTNKVLSFFVFILFINIFSGVFSGIIRQGISLSFFIFSLNSAYHRNLKSFLLLIFFGALFHYSILITIPIYFFTNRNFSKIFYLTSICLAIILYGLLRVVNIPLLIIGKFGVYTGYLQERYQIFFQPMSFPSHVLIGLFVCIYLLMVMHKQKIIKTNKDQFVFNLFLFSTFCCILMLSTNLLSRVEYYLMIGTILGVPLFTRIFKKTSISIVMLLILAFCFIGSIYLLYTLGEIRTLIPYQARFNFFYENRL